MKAYSSMPSGEFIDQIRNALIRANAGPLVIDAVDKLHELKTQEEFDEEREEIVAEYDRGHDDAQKTIDKLEDRVAELEAQLEDAQERLNDLAD